MKGLNNIEEKESSNIELQKKIEKMINELKEETQKLLNEIKKE
jgi:hypothetical protein